MTSHFDTTDEATFKERIAALDTLIRLDALPQPETPCNVCGRDYLTVSMVGGTTAIIPFGGFVCGSCLYSG